MLVTCVGCSKQIRRAQVRYIARCYDCRMEKQKLYNKAHKKLLQDAQDKVNKKYAKRYLEIVQEQAALRANPDPVVPPEPVPEPEPEPVKEVPKDDRNPGKTYAEYRKESVAKYKAANAAMMLRLKAEKEARDKARGFSLKEIVIMERTSTFNGPTHQTEN